MRLLTFILVWAARVCVTGLIFAGILTWGHQRIEATLGSTCVARTEAK